VGYWKLVEPIWDTVSIYDGPETFLRQYNASPEASRVLFAAHWTQSEVLNGGFDQYFFNSTGVLAPEAASAFRQIGMPQTAAAVERAMSFFGIEYPRDRDERQEAIDTAHGASGDEDFDPFQEADDLFFDLIGEENGGFEAAADAYAASATDFEQ
jgi:hypothetical protein